MLQLWCPIGQRKSMRQPSTCFNLLLLCQLGQGWCLLPMSEGGGEALPAWPPKWGSRIRRTHKRSWTGLIAVSCRESSGYSRISEGNNLQDLRSLAIGKTNSRWSNSNCGFRMVCGHLLIKSSNCGKRIGDIGAMPAIKPKDEYSYLRFRLSWT